MKNLALAEFTIGLRLHPVRVLALFFIVLAVVGGSMSAVSAEPIRLTEDHRFKRDPVFIQGGSELVFVLLERPEQLRLMLLSMADWSVKTIHPDATTSELEPAFSPNSRYYAFLQSRSPASVGMVIRDTKDKKDAEISPEPGLSGMRSPAFSPDNRRVIYAFPAEGRQHIYSVNTQGTDRKQLTNSLGINNWPSFSPDGKHILLSSTRDGNYELYVIKADGSGARRLTNRPSQELRPRFSPGGRRIAFTSNRDGNFEIYLINTDGSGLKRLTNHPERDDFPAWHPDGEHLVIVSERAGRHDLYLIEVP